MGIKNQTIGFIIMAMAILVIITFAVNFQTANSSSNSLLSDSETAGLKQDAGSYLVNYSTDAQDINNIYYNSTLTASSNTLYIPSQNTIGTKSWKTPFLVIQRALSYSYVKLVGGSGSEYAFVFNAIIAVISLTFVYYLIKFIRIGLE